MQPIVSTPDTYESAFYLALGAEITAVECQQINGKIACTLRITGEDINTLQYHYFKKTAEVNLHAFRKAYHHVNMLIVNAKKEYKKQQEGVQA